MDELARKVEAEQENVEAALKNLQTAIERMPRSVIELAAIATFLHNVYNGIENILKQVLVSRGIRLTRTASWHKDILERAASEGVISQSLRDELYRYLAFRHFFVHAYGFMLEEERFLDLASNAPTVWSRFLSEVRRGIP